jgi:hypothetical protein
MLLVIILLLWFADAAPAFVPDWRAIFTAAMPMLIGALVALGLITTVVLMVIRRGEEEHRRLFFRWVDTKEFRDALDDIRKPKEEKFLRLIEKAAEAADKANDLAMKAHNAIVTEHSPIRHDIINKINDVSMTLSARIDKLERAAK